MAKNNAVEKAESIMKKNQEKAQHDQKIQNAKMHKKAEQEKRKAMLRRDKQRKKAMRLAEKESAKQERENMKEYNSSENNSSNENSKSKNNHKGWLAAVITLSVVCFILASILTYMYIMPSEEEKMLDAGYTKSFYDTVEQVDNIDLNLSKALATSDNGAIQKYLVDTAINSELAENDLQSLPLQDENKYYTTKLVNQIGDYSKYLNNKIINGENLSDEDVEGLKQLYNANRQLKESLQSMRDEMKSDFSFVNMKGKDNVVLKNFEELQNLSVEYPELIYDGPFSDAIDNREIKGLQGLDITENQAREEFIKIFSSYGLDDIQELGMVNGEIESYAIQAMVNDDILYAQISKKGGKLILFSYAGSCNDNVYSREQAEESALAFFKKMGLEDMKPVWVNLANNVYTINFTYEINGTPVYSDMVKVRVCAETNMVIGLEANAYFTNHTERLISSPSISMETAKSKVSSKIDIEAERLAIIPIGNSSEKLAYEFYGKHEDSSYYVYIDAITGKQVEMFKVIDSTDGMFLM